MKPSADCYELKCTVPGNRMLRWCVIAQRALVVPPNARSSVALLRSRLDVSCQLHTLPRRFTPQASYGGLGKRSTDSIPVCERKQVAFVQLIKPGPPCSCHIKIGDGGASIIRAPMRKKPRHKRKSRAFKIGRA